MTKTADPATGLKFDVGKSPMFRGLAKYFSRALQAVADNSNAGFKKYGSWGGWRTVPDAKERYADALVRHVMAHARGEVIDPETGSRHIAMAAWNALAVTELELSEEPQK